MTIIKSGDLMKIRDIDIFSPFIIVFGIFLYLALALIAYCYQIRNLEFVSPTAIFYVFYGTFFFLVGVFTPKVFGKTSGILKAGFWASKLEKKLMDEKTLFFVVLIGIFLQGLNIYLLGGIPLFSGYLKSNACTHLWVISYLIFLPSINILIAKFNKKEYYFLFFVGLLLFAITGYRTTTLAIVLSVFITSYYTRKLKLMDFLIFTSIILILGISIGYVAVKSIEWQHWNLNPLELVFYRAGFTLGVLDKIIPIQGSTGGEVFYYTLTGFFKSVDPRVIVGNTALGYKSCITSTIFGPALLDFGYTALAIQMFLIGLILKMMHNVQKIKKGVYTALYAIILAHTLIWIETGPTDLIVWIFYIMAVISLLVGRIYR